VHTKKYQLEERRRQLAAMLAQSMTEQDMPFQFNGISS